MATGASTDKAVTMRSQEDDAMERTTVEGPPAEIGALRSATDDELAAEVKRRARAGSVFQQEEDGTIIVGDEGRLTLPMAAERLGVSLEALRKRIVRARRDGKWVPFRTVGDVGKGRLMVDEQDLKEWDATFRRRRA